MTSDPIPGEAYTTQNMGDLRRRLSIAWLVVSAGERGTVIARAPPLTFEDGLVAVARMAVVGVGLGGALALIALLAGIREFRVRMRDKILWSFVAVGIDLLAQVGLGLRGGDLGVGGHFADDVGSQIGGDRDLIVDVAGLRRGGEDDGKPMHHRRFFRW